MKLRMILLMLILGLMGSSAPAAAQQPDKDPPKPNNARFGDPTTVAPEYQGFLYGVIVELNKDSMVLTKTKFGTDQTFKFNKKTKFIRDGKPNSLESMQKGDKVWVAVDKDKKSGDLIARKVITGVDLTP